MRFRLRYLVVAFVAATAIAVLLRGQGSEPPTPAAPDPTSSRSSEAVVAEEPPTTGGQEEHLESGARSGDVIDATDPASPLTDRSVGGAVSSVLVFLELSEEVVLMSPDEGASVQRRYATVATAESSAAELSAQLQELRAAAGPEMSLEVAPISWMVTEVEPQVEYAVSVWYVEIFSLGGPTDAFGAFKTYSAATRWEDGSWKLGESEVFDGPQPVVPSDQAATGFELRAQLAGFSDGGRLVPLLLALQGEGDR